MRISLVQMNAGPDKSANIASVEKLVDEAAADHPDLVVLPEYWAFFSNDRDDLHASADTFPDGSAYRAMQEMAKRHKVTLHGGSVAERRDGAVHNTTVVFDPDGTEIACYRKMHLYDVDLPDGTQARESDIIARGTDVVTYRCAGKTVGCSICYDLRFPELFRALRDKGADVIVLPAAFMLGTGKDHWEVLSRARAIETQTHFVAVGQIGKHLDGLVSTYGHSMVVDPWGHVVAQVGDHVGTTTVRIDDAYKEQVRAALPVHRHHVM